MPAPRRSARSSRRTMAARGWASSPSSTAKAGSARSTPSSTTRCWTRTPPATSRSARPMRLPSSRRTSTVSTVPRSTSTSWSAPTGWTSPASRATAIAFRSCAPRPGSCSHVPGQSRDMSHRPDEVCGRLARVSATDQATSLGPGRSGEDARGRKQFLRRICVWAAAPHAYPYRGRPRERPIPRSSERRDLADGRDDLVRQAREAGQELGALALQPLDVRVVLVHASRALVQLARLEHLVVVDARYRGGYEVPEIRVALPLDRSVCDALDDRRRVLDADLLRALVVVTAADASGVQEIHLERMLLEQLEEAIALQVVRHREERVRSRHAQRLSGLVRAAGGRAFRLAEHEKGRCLRPLELCDGRDHVVVLVQDEQEVSAFDLALRGGLDHADGEADLVAALGGDDLATRVQR